MDENNLNQAYTHLLMRMEQHFEAAERAARCAQNSNLES